MEVETDAPADLRRTLETLWRRKVWVIGAVAIAVLVSLGLSLRSTKIYAASAEVQLPDVVQTSIVSEQQLNLGDPEQIAASQVSIAESERVSREVARTLGPRFGDVESVNVEPIDENTAMSIEVRSSVPSVAQDGANAYADAYVAERQDLVSRLFTKRAERLDEYAAELQLRAADLQIRLDQFDADIATRQLEEPTPEREAQLAPLRSARAQVFTEREALSANIEQALQRADEWRLEAQSQTESTADIITPAELPSNPVSPTPIRDAVIAAAIGLVLGLGLVFGREALEATVGNAEDAERLLPDVPVLGSTFELSRRRHRWGQLPSRLFRRPETRGPPGPPVVLADPSSAMAEAYRSVRTGLELVVGGGVVLVTSPAPVDGKTTTAVNLAASLAIDGKRVVLASGDLRRPRLHEHFGLPNNLGVTSVLQGHATVDEVLQRAPGATEGLEILVAGPRPQNPAELLSSPAARDLFDALSERSDYVIVDSPPVLAVTDAVVTAQWTDAVVLVARQRFTARRSLVSAADLLRHARAKLAGVILAGVAPSRRSSYAYYYDGATAGSVDGVASAPSTGPPVTVADNGAATSQGMKTTPDPEPSLLGWRDSAEASTKLIENGGDLDEASGLVRLGTVPLLRGAQDSVAKEQAMAAVRDSYRTMRANVASLGDSEPIGSILVTCAGIMEHKSYAVANLSGAFAEKGSTVIALSCDWRHSQLHRLYGLPGDVGFTDVIDGMSPSQALRPVGFDGRLMVLASGSEPPNLAELLGSSRVVAALRHISLNCDVLVIDGAPVLEDPGVLALSPALDTTLLVATVGITTMGDLSSAVAAVKQSGATRLGTVLTGVHADDVKV